MKPIEGKDVYTYLKKLGNENHDDDPLTYIKSEILRNQYTLQDVPVTTILKRDVDAKWYVGNEMKDFKDDYTKRKVKSPILLDKDYMLKDGYHRLAQTVFNGQKKIKAFLPL